ncbi:MAG: phytochrome sensor protein [Candidatus Poribacteria bacterium]|nr:MAG: phytochrome sensor protein [Candidatus Poribacteria bacterium]
MPSYRYEAVTASGSRAQGTMDASSPQELVHRLREMGYFLTRVEEAVPQESRSGLRRLFRRRIGARDVEFFTLQLSTLINSGVPLDRALSVCSEQMENPALRRVVEEVRYDVEHGASLADAMEKHPRQFDALYTNMVRAGQEGGVLGLVLQRLAVFKRQQRELRESVTSAMIYPVVLLVFTVIVVSVLMLFVIPRFIAMFQDLNVELPITTRLLMGLVGFLTSPYGIFWAPGGVPLPGATLTLVVVLIAALWRYRKTERGRRFFDRLRMRLPLVGPVFRNFALVRFTQTMSTLLENGVTLLPALRISKDTTGSVLFEEVLERAAQEVERGASLSGPLSESPLFPPIVVDMLAIGEESGKPEVMLTHLAEYYDMEIKRSLERLVAALGPILILIMAGIVLFIAVSIILPIFNISRGLGTA